MHVFIAAARAQGDSPEDHYCCVDGEIVIWDTEGPRRHQPDDSCECLRGFFGAYSSGHATAALVVDDPEMTLAQLQGIIRDALVRDSGSGRGAWPMTRTIAQLAASFEDGAIVDRDRNLLTPRWVPSGLADWGGHSHPIERGDG